MRYSDDQIFEVLEEVHLKEKVFLIIVIEIIKLSDGINTDMIEVSSIFSVGEK
jgi:hypothetical protein